MLLGLPSLVKEWGRLFDRFQGLVLLSIVVYVAIVFCTGEDADNSRNRRQILTHRSVAGNKANAGGATNRNAL